MRALLGALAALTIVGLPKTVVAQQAPAIGEVVYAPPQIPPRNETPEARRARWEAWRGANTDIDARIATFLRDTEAQVAAYRNRPPVDRFAALRAGVTSVQQREALTYFGNAFTIWQSGDFSAAEIGFRRGLEIDPTNAAANFYMGDLLRRRGENAGAREHYERSVAFGAASAEAMRAEAALAELATGVDRSLDLPVVTWSPPSAPLFIWDCADCPEMVTVPAGSFTLGSAEGEAATPIVDLSGGRPATMNGAVRLQADQALDAARRRVTFGEPIAVGRFEVTRSQYAAFAAANPGRADLGCLLDRQHPGQWELDNRVTWRNAFSESFEDDPVVCVDFRSAAAYCEWLSQVTGQHYVLLSSELWEYAAKAGTMTAYWTGSSIVQAQANFGRTFTRPRQQGSYMPNGFALYDMNGNVSEWVTHDCGSAATHQCFAMNRGGSWADGPERLRSATFELSSRAGKNTVGFRVARVLRSPS